MADEEYPIRPLTIYARGGNTPNTQVAQNNTDWGTATFVPLPQPKTMTDWGEPSFVPLPQGAGAASPSPAPPPAANSALAPAGPAGGTSSPGNSPETQNNFGAEKPVDMSQWEPTQSAQQAPSLFERAFGIIPRPQDYGRIQREQAQGGMDAMKSGVEQFKEGNYGKGALQTALGGLGYVTSPVTALATDLAGDPVRRTTGSDKLGGYAEFAAGLMAPGPKPFAPLRASKPAQTVEKIFSPTTVGPGAQEAEAGVRKFGGQAARDTAQTENVLEEHQRLVASMDEPARRNFISYVEGKSAGPLQPEQQALADKLRDAYQQRRTSLQNLTRTQQMNFIDDYFVHLWEDPAAARQVFGGASKEGRTGFTKGRSLPTIEDGIVAGLKPKTLDPIEATMHYVANADRFIATERTFEEARSLGTVKYYLPGKQPNGWVKVNGRLGEKGALDAYAPEDWARVYNNFIDRGIQGPWKDVYDVAQRASNSITAMELGLSAYHARTMAKEAVFNQLAKAIGQGVHMRPGQALKTLAGAPLAPLTLARTGAKLEKAYLGSTQSSAAMKKIAELLTEAGGRGKGGVAHTGGEYAFSRNGDFVKAWKRGTLKMEMLADAQTIKSSPLLGTAKVGAKNIGRIMTTVAAPLFEKYIPRLKNGAFYENMSAWLEHNAGAPHEEQVKAARQIWDSVDNRFGEMVKDNIFWNKTFKQLAQLAARSYSWDLGTVREIGGGIKDLASRKWTPRAEYLIALPIGDGLMNATYQYLKTGQAPQSLMDLAAPRTGGVNADGTEERAGPIGYMRDVYGWLEDPVQEATNKVATAPRTAIDLARNKDWRGMPIAPPTDKEKSTYENTAAWLGSYLGYVGSKMVPISAQAFKQTPDSNIPLWERLLGTQPAGMKYTNPERLESVKDYFGKRDWRAKERADEKEKRKYQGVD